MRNQERATDPAPKEDEGEDFLTRSRKDDSSLLEFFDEAKTLFAESQPSVHTGDVDPDPDILPESPQQKAARPSINQVH